MKKSILFLFYILQTYCFYGQNYDLDREILWEISGQGLKKKSYLFGSLHSNDKRVFQFSDSVFTALNHSDKLVLEADIFGLFDALDTRSKLPSTLFDKNGQPYTAEGDASKTFYGDENGMPQFLDAYFQQYFLNAGKDFFPLESAEEQYNLLSDELQMNNFNRKVIDNAFNNFNHDQLLNLYLKGELNSIDRFLKANMSFSDGLYESVITNRNVQMTLKLDSLLKLKQNFFCAVGAGHLGGTNGIINLLRSKGYKLRLVSWHHSEVPTDDQREVQSFKQYVYRDERSGLIAQFPGKPLIAQLEANETHLIYRELGQGNTFEISISPLEPGTSIEELAAIYIASPPNTRYQKIVLDDGNIVFEGLSDTYPEGLNFVQIQVNDAFFAVIKAYGGNKFMHSNRPKQFFLKVWFE